METGGHLSSKHLVYTALNGNGVDYWGATQILKNRIGGFITTKMLKHSSMATQEPKNGWGNCPTCGIGTEDSFAHFLTTCRQSAKARRELLHPEILGAEISKALKAAAARRLTALSDTEAVAVLAVVSMIESERGVSLAHLDLSPIGGMLAGEMTVADGLVRAGKFTLETMLANCYDDEANGWPWTAGCPGSYPEAS